MAQDGFVLVHHPCHNLGSRVYVGRRDIDIWSDEVSDLAHVAPAQALQFTYAHALGIADDTTLSTAKRDVDDRCLPRHPRGERPNRVERFLRMKPQSSLARASCRVVLHAEPGKDTGTSVIHSDGDADSVLVERLPKESPRLI